MLNFTMPQPVIRSGQVRLSGLVCQSERRERGSETHDIHFTDALPHHVEACQQTLFTTFLWDDISWRQETGHRGTYYTLF